jgi:hypothetical protein
VDGTVNFNDVSSGIVLGFCLGLLRAAEEVLVGSDVISSTVRARVFDLRLAIVLFGIFVVGGLDNGLDSLLLLFR